MTLKQLAHQVTKKGIISTCLVTLLLTICSAALLAQENAGDLLDAADPSVATVIFCQSAIITPTPTPVVPEPGSGALLLIGLALLILSAMLLRWTRRGAKRLSVLLLASGLMAGGFGVERLTAQAGSCGLTVEVNGQGQIDSRDLRCQSACQVPGVPGEIRHFKAVPTTGSQFAAWRVNGEPYAGPVQMTGDTILTAIFEPIATPTPTPTATPTPVNQPPVAVNNRYETAEDAPLTIAAPGVLNNDRDPDGDALTAQRVADPAHGALTLHADGAFTYTPNADFSGLDQFIYRANDGALDSAIAVVTIDVAGSNDAPVATDVTVTTVKNQPVAMTLVGSDPDGGDLTYQIVDIPAQGDLRGGDNHFTYTPATDFVGQQTFTYRVNDSELDSNLATVTIKVIDVDLAITGVDVSQTIFDPETMTVSGDVTVTWTNAGAVPVVDNYTVKVYVEDSQTNTTIDLGTAVVATPLNPGETGSAVVSVNGAIRFKDQPVHAVVDSENVIAESNERNNLANTLLDCQYQQTEFTQIVNLDAYQCSSITIPLEAGHYLISPIGQADGGQWNAWNAWGVTSGCNSEGICLDGGWVHGYHIFSPSLGAIYLGTPQIFANDLLALAHADGTEIWLSTQEEVNFAIKDRPCYDNQGGVSLKIIPIEVTCEDYSASYLRFDAHDAPDTLTIIARIGNAGVVDAAIPLNVAFYDGDPANGGTLLGVTTTHQKLLSGTFEDVAFTWNAPPLGQHQIVVVVDDDGTGKGKIRESNEANNTARATFDISDNQPPVITSTPPIDGAEGELYQYQVRATDPNGDLLTYTLLNAPDGMTITTAEGLISWTPAANQSGEWTVTVWVSDGRGGAAQQHVTITVSETINMSLTIAITRPADGAEAPLDAPLMIAAEATATHASISKVAFYATNTLFGGETTLFGEAMSAPYSAPWTLMTPGIYEVIARAYSDSGIRADSAPVHIVVQNGQPDITSEPTYSAPIGQLYTYDVEATDPNGDTLTFSLQTAPDGMTIDAASGLISWTPTAAQVGQQTFRVIVDDGRGAGAGQTVEMFVPEPNNTPPRITSTPPFIATVGQTYQYDVDATDADGDPLTFRFLNAIDGMSLTPQSGLISVTPTAAQIGTHVVTVIADDGRYGIGGQTYALTVKAPNGLPTVSLVAPSSGAKIEAGNAVTFRADASDRDGSIARVVFTLDGAALGAAATAPYQVEWTAAEPGEHTVSATAYDSDSGETTSAPVTLTVIEPRPDTDKPVVTISVTPQNTTLGSPVTITVTVSDASAITTETLTIDGIAVPLTNHQATYAATAAGFHAIVATATDAAGNTGSATAQLGVSDGSDTTPPEVDLHDDVEFQCVELKVDPYDILGSVSDDKMAQYRLRTREKGANTWQTLSEGATAAFDGNIATFDPTTHRNGIHDVELTATDAAGQTATVTGCLFVNGRFKAGHVTLGGIDANLPELGFPLLAGRVYDSRNLDGGSFGPGWAMPHEASNVQAEFTYEPSEGWGEDVQGGLFSTYVLVSHSRKVLSLRLGDGVFAFRMEVTPKTSFMRPIMDNATPLTVSYVPINDTKGTLEALGVASQVFLFSDGDGTLADADGTPYDPQRFKLTLEDGSIYIFDTTQGLVSMTDPYGHAIEYSDDSLTHSSGASLTIARDTSNRIERVTDPLGRTIEYQYNADGMLERVTQTGSGSFAARVLENYAYGQGVLDVPVMKDIIAPDGTRLGTFEYDSAGRKTGLIDHNGNRILFGYDAPEHHYAVTDRRGNPTEYVYDSEGNVTEITDAEGNTERYSYDADGRVRSKTNKLGYTTAYTYDADGNLLTETDPAGNASRFTYDSKGNKLTATDPLGNTTTFTYDDKGKVLTQKDALNHVTSFTYDDDGLLTQTTNALNETTSYGYDAQGNMTAITDALGQRVRYRYDLYGHIMTSTDKGGKVTTNEYNGSGSLIKTIDAAGKAHQYTHNDSHKIEQYIDPLGHRINNSFDSNGQLAVAKDASGHEVRFGYDPNGNQTTLDTIVTTGNGPQTFTIEKVYDALNRPTAEIDGDGRSVQAEYDALGRQTASIDKQGNRAEMTYDVRGLPIKQTSTNGESVTNTYDAAGRLTSQTNAKGGVTTYTYNAIGNITRQVSPNGVVTENTYDALGRLTHMSTSQGASISLEYDAVGRLISQTDESGKRTQYVYASDGQLAKTVDSNGRATTYEYDQNGAVTRILLPDNSSIRYAYDDAGRKIAETDQHGHTTSFAYDERGQLTTVRDAAGHATEYTYNDIGYLIATTDANGHATHYEYDTLGRMTKKTSPLGMSQTFQYGEGNTFSVTDYNGDTIEYAYDTAGRIIRVSLPGGEITVYTYAGSGDLLRVTDARGMTSFAYDGDGRLLQRTEPDGRPISYGYDAAGRRTSVTTPSGTTQYDYDDAGRLVRVIAPSQEITRYLYDAENNLQQIIYPNGTITEYRYDAFNRMIAVEHRGITGEVLLSSTYTLGAQGERLSVTEYDGAVTNYTYNELDQLTEEIITASDGSARTIAYTYDPAGNRLTKSDNGVITAYTYDDNDRLLTAGNIAYAYDNNGNLLSRTAPGMTQRFTYDALNQQVHAEITDGQGTSTIAYQYDHDGIRVGKTINGTDAVTYLVDANRPYAQVIEETWKRGSLSATTTYVYGHGLISQTIDGAHHFYHDDGFHHTRALSDMNGAVTDTYGYDAYGTVLHQAGVTKNPYLYRGEQFDAETNAYYLRARYYQPDTGRFTSVDPLEGNPSDPMTLHRYAYGNNDPINNVDPSGETTLIDMQMTAKIAGILSVGSAGGWFAGNFGPVGDVYEVLAENFFPDAGIIGGSLFTKGKLAAPTHMQPKTMQALRFISSFLKPSPIDLLLEGMAGMPPISQVWQEPINAGLIGGFEGIFSFGSGQSGSYLYWGAQIEGGYTRAFRHTRWGIDISLYSGYIFNLWNYDNYLGPFMAINLPQGSFSCNPGRILGDNLDKGFEKNSPWGLSRPFFSSSLLRSHGTSQMVGINGSLYYRFPIFGGPVDVSYGELAVKWTGIQIAVTSFLAWSGNKDAAIVNGIAGASTGMIVKSKEIYNKRHNFYQDTPNDLYPWEGALYERRTKARPQNWMSGPENGIGWLLGLVM